MRKLDGLEIEQNLAFERREWKLQRAAWVLMAAAVIGSLLGLTGGGLLADARARTPIGGLQVDYERFLRRDSDSQIVVAAGPQPGRDTLRLWFDRRHLQQLDIEHVTPEPVGHALVGDRIEYAFLRADPGATARIRFDIRAKAAGPLQARIGIGDSDEALAFSQFVYP